MDIRKTLKNVAMGVLITAGVAGSANAEAGWFNNMFGGGDSAKVTQAESSGKVSRDVARINISGPTDKLKKDILAINPRGDNQATISKMKIKLKGIENRINLNKVSKNYGSEYQDLETAKKFLEGKITEAKGEVLPKNYYAEKKFESQKLSKAGIDVHKKTNAGVAKFDNKSRIEGIKKELKKPDPSFHTVRNYASNLKSRDVSPEQRKELTNLCAEIAGIAMEHDKNGNKNMASFIGKAAMQINNVIEQSKGSSVQANSGWSR